jgi:Mannose-1-phosphate guanylyltransferase
MLHCVIMAGGLGTRFWPLSLRTCPKQFLSFDGGDSLIQKAFHLIEPVIPADRVWVVTSERFQKLTVQHLPAVPADQILLEPCGRNTAPCLGLAAISLLAKDPDAIMLVMSADHLITPAEEFARNIQLAQRMVEETPESLVLFGVPPTYPSTGFGYIERGDSTFPGVFQVKSFREKPDRETAEAYLRDGRFFWNCGIFAWRADEILRRLQQHEPEIHAFLEELRPHLGRPSWQKALQEIFPQMKSISIDYAVLEQGEGISVVEASFLWDDVGTWEALGRIFPADADGNVTVGNHVGVETRNCIIRSVGNHLVGTVGLENLLVVHTEQATLVARRNDDAGIRQLLAAIENRSLDGYL